MIDFDKIERRALQVLEASGITEPVIDAVKIANENGISVKEIEMPKSHGDVAGFLNKEEKTIYVAKNDAQTRQLFTVAHELGHYFLSHQNYSVLLRIPNKEGLYTEKESEANSFAAYLLMPDFLMREYMEKYHLTRENYRVMANIFGVPLSAMKTRFSYFNG